MNRYEKTEFLYILFKLFVIIALSFCLFMILNKKEVQQIQSQDNCEQEIEKLKTRSYNDSVALNAIEKDYYKPWEENQIFSSMLSEIEGEPGGHEILKKLWNEKNQIR